MGLFVFPRSPKSPKPIGPDLRSQEDESTERLHQELSGAGADSLHLAFSQKLRCNPRWGDTRMSLPGV